MSDNKKNGAKTQSFLHGSAVLLIATALVKIIGAIYRIPLSNLLGETGMGYYSTAYDLYLPMYSLAMAGLPVAVSRIIAEHVAANRCNDVAVTFKVARRAFLTTGGIGFLLMCALAYPFVLYTKNAGALPAVLCIAPCLLACCIMSAYRGYYEGLKNMTPTAVSQVVEAFGKLILGFGLAYAVIYIKGDKSTKTLSVAAAAALVGITVGTVFSALYLIIKYKKGGALFTQQQLKLAPTPATQKAALKGLVAIAIPIVLGSFVTYITSFIDVIMVQRQLSKAVNNAPQVFQKLYGDFIAYKQTKDIDFSLRDLPNALYGCHRGFAYSIYNLVPVITSVLGVSAIPILASAWVKDDKKGIRFNIETIIRTTSLISMPAGIGIFALSGPILNLLYSGNRFAVKISTPNLRILGVAAVFAGLTIPMTSMLQAIGKQNIPVRNIAIGAIAKIIINFTLVGMPYVNIKGVPVGTAVCYIFICVANFIALVKYAKVKLNLLSILGKPFIAAVVCGVVAYLLSSLNPASKIHTLAAIAVAGIVYLAAIAVLKAVEREDVLSLPKGDKIAEVLAKLRIIK